MVCRLRCRFTPPPARLSENHQNGDHHTTLLLQVLGAFFSVCAFALCAHCTWQTQLHRVACVEIDPTSKPWNMCVPQPTHEYHTPILLTGTCAKKSRSHVPPKNNEHYFRFRIVFRKPLIYYTHTISTFSYLSTVQQHPGYNRFVRSTNAYTQSSYNLCYPTTVVIKPIGTDWQAPLSVAFR